ncbi:MAG TPA: hypothetical protein VFQ72_02615 [Candidatus Paceibacterota bacterium]|nr:hypothetical protein [Candidatus Paceibacterota bacterium]
MNLKALIVLIFAVAVVIAAAFHHQNARIHDGSLIVLNPTKGCFVGGRLFVDLKDKTIVSKASIFSVTLWQDKNGQVFANRPLIAIRALFVAVLPANSEELAIYRSYFPTS